MPCNLGSLLALLLHLVSLLRKNWKDMFYFFSLGKEILLRNAYFQNTCKTNQCREKCRAYVNFNLKNLTWKSSHWRCSIKKVFLKTSQNFLKKYPCLRFCFNKVAGHRLQLYLKRDSNKSVSLWILCKFFKNVFFS